MSTAQTLTPEEQAEFGHEMIQRMLGATITAFGANAGGGVLIGFEKDGVRSAAVIEVDEDGDAVLSEAATAKEDQ